MKLVEILAVVSIIGILLGVMLWPFSNFRDEKLLDGAAEDILTLLDEARTRTLSSDGASPYGVYFESGRITLFKGAVFNAAAPDNKEVSIHNRLTISGITLAGGVVSVVFKRLTGATDQSGAVTVSLATDNSRQRVITVSAAGSAGIK